MKKLLLTIVAAVVAIAATAASNDSDGQKSRTHFAWGAEFGSTVDLSAHDMTSIDFSANFGFRRGWLSFLGVGAGAHLMVGNSCRTYPIYACLRTSFTSRPSILFMDLRGGVAMHYLDGSDSQAKPYVSAGLGVNLARSSTFTSYIIIGYTYFNRSDIGTGDDLHRYDDLHCGTVRLGVCF